jgi:ribosomal protein L15
MGVEKLLGSGSVTGSYEVTVASFTKKAQAKIEGAGGKVAAKE